MPADEIMKLVPAETRSLLAEQLRHLGFKFVTIDLEGFRSGSLNALVELSTGDRPANSP